MNFQDIQDCPVNVDMEQKKRISVFVLGRHWPVSSCLHEVSIADGVMIDDIDFNW